jgi:FAD/FMN-containing dehydrogenase
MQAQTINQAKPVESLRSALSGELFCREEAGYFEAKFAWNVTIDQQPDIVVVPANTQDVQTAVRFAAEHQMPIAVQATGHGQPRSIEGGMLINTSKLNSVSIDAGRRLARMGGGAVWNDVIPLAYEAGLAPLSGSSPNVGVVGYTLGGGFGLMARTYGLAIDSVRQVEIVTPDGNLLQASENENAELFWALLGGGGAFGVVTEITMELYPSPDFYGGALLYPADRAPEIYRAYGEYTKDLSTDVTTAMVTITFPPVPFVPEPLQGKSFVIISVCVTGSRGPELLQPLRDLGPVMDHVRSCPYTESASVFNDPVDPLPAFGQGIMLTDYTEETAAAMLEAIGDIPTSPNLMIQLRHIDGLPHDSHGSLGSRRKAKYFLYFLGVPLGPATPQSMDEQAKRVFKALEPWVLCRGPLNWLGERNVPSDAIAEVFGAEAFTRLAGLKAELDPQNLFRYAGIGICLAEAES